MKKLIFLSLFLSSCATTGEWSEQKCFKYMEEHFGSYPMRHQCDKYLGEEL